MLSSAILPLKLCIIWSDPFSDVSYFCVVYVYNDCPRMNQSHQSHHSRTGLTSHIFYAYNTFIIFTFLSFRCQVWQWQQIWRIRWWWIRLWFYFQSVLFAVRCELCSDRVISSRVGISSIFLRSSTFSILCSSIQVILNRVSIFLIFLHSSMFSICLSSSRVILNRVSIFLIFSRSSIFSRSNE